MAIENENNKRIAKNTMYLYIRMLFSLLVGLYTSRVVLQTLGISDYGLYNVVGGFVSIFMFINGTMTVGTQRFLSYEIGKGNIEKLKKVFSNAVIIHICIALILGIMCHVGIDVGTNTTAPKILMERLGMTLADAGFATSLYFIFRTAG